MRNALLDEAQGGIKIAGRNINNLRYADDTTLTAGNEHEWSSLLMKVKEESEKAGLKLIIQKEIMAPHPIISWEIDGETMETWQSLYSWAPKSLQMVTAAIKLKDAPWTKSDDQSRQHIKKQRLLFADKGPCSQSYDFSSSHVWMWELDYKESWVPKNWWFWTMEKTVEGPLDCKEIKPVNLKESILNIHCKDWCQTWISNTLATWCQITDSLKKPLMLGKIEGRRRRGRQRIRWLDSIINLMDMSLSPLQELVMDRKFWHAAVHGIEKCQTWLRDWDEVILSILKNAKENTKWICLE